MELRPLVEDDISWLEPAFQDYLGEVAPGITVGPHDRWWSEIARAGLAICAPEPKGFAMIREHAPRRWDFCEFYIQPRARRRGLGLAAARQILTERPGFWQLGVVKAGGAARFWEQVLDQTPGVAHLSEHPPLTPVQILSYRFTMLEAPECAT